mgnify:FL=1
MEGLVDQELGSFSLLLCDLFLLNGLGELWPEVQVRDRDVIEHDVKVLAPVCQTVPDLLRNLLSLRQELRGIVASDDRLEDLVGD